MKLRWLALAVVFAGSLVGCGSSCPQYGQVGYGQNPSCPVYYANPCPSGYVPAQSAYGAGYGYGTPTYGTPGYGYGYGTPGYGSTGYPTAGGTAGAQNCVPSNGTTGYPTYPGTGGGVTTYPH